MTERGERRPPLMVHTRTRDALARKPQLAALLKFVSAAAPIAYAPQPADKRHPRPSLLMPALAVLRLLALEDAISIRSRMPNDRSSKPTRGRIGSRPSVAAGISRGKLFAAASIRGLKSRLGAGLPDEPQFPSSPWCSRHRKRAAQKASGEGRSEKLKSSN